MVPAGTAPTKQKTLHRSKRHRSKEASATAKTATIAAKQQKDSREAVPFQHPAAKKRRVVAAAAAADETRVVADDNTAATAGTVPGSFVRAGIKVGIHFVLILIVILMFLCMGFLCCGSLWEEAYYVAFQGFPRPNEDKTVS